MSGEKLTTCKHCGATISKSAKTCPHCGGKNKKSKGCLIILIILFAIAWFIFKVALGMMNSYIMSDDAESMTEEEYKSSCTEMSYDELARTADNIVGQKVKFTGEVQQVVIENESFDSEYRVAVTKSEYDWYEADSCVYVYYNLGENPRILQGDIITFYGEVSGFEEYTSTADVHVKIPSVTALYVTIDY